MAARRVQPSSTTLANREGPQDPGILSSSVVGHGFPRMPGIFSLLYSKTLNERALSCSELGGRTVQAHAGPRPGGRACPLDSSVGGTHPHGRERLPSPPARGLSCRWGAAPDAVARFTDAEVRACVASRPP